MILFFAVLFILAVGAVGLAVFALVVAAVLLIRRALRRQRSRVLVGGSLNHVNGHTRRPSG